MNQKPSLKLVVWHDLDQLILYLHRLGHPQCQPQSAINHIWVIGRHNMMLFRLHIQPIPNSKSKKLFAYRMQIGAEFWINCHLVHSLQKVFFFLVFFYPEKSMQRERGIPHFIIMSLNLNADFPENYSPRALKNPHIASSLQQPIYGKNDSSVDSNGNSARFRYDSFELRLIIFGKQF